MPPVIGDPWFYCAVIAWLCCQCLARAANIEPKKMGAASGVFWGSVSGFTSFMTPDGDPPFQVYVLPQRLPKLVLVGATTMFFAVVNAMKIVPCFMLG